MLLAAELDVLMSEKALIGSDLVGATVGLLLRIVLVQWEIDEAYRDTMMAAKIQSRLEISIRRWRFMNVFVASSSKQEMLWREKSRTILYAKCYVLGNHHQQCRKLHH